MIEIIDFLEFDDVMEKLRAEAKRLYPEKQFIPFWRILLDGDEVVIRATVSDGNPGPQGHVELRKSLKENSDV